MKYTLPALTLAISAALSGCATPHSSAVSQPVVDSPVPNVAQPLQRQLAEGLYEMALEGVVLFLILNLFIRKPRPTGSVSGLFLIGYGLFRIIVEFFRQPDAQFTGGWVQYISMGQILSIPMVLAGIIMMVWAYRHRPQQQNS